MTQPLVLPRLADAVVVLRSFEDRDVPLVQRVSCDPVIPLITTVPATPDAEAVRAYLQRQRTRAQDGTYYSFAIADATTDQAVGQIGLWAPGASGCTSTGYWIAAEHRRTGIAARALALVSRWAFTVDGVQRVELRVEPWNEGSWRTAEKVGYQREGLMRAWKDVAGVRRDMYLYSLLPSDPVTSLG